MPTPVKKKLAEDFASTEKKLEVCRWRREGLTVREIAAKVGLSKSRVGQMIQEIKAEVIEEAKANLDHARVMEIDGLDYLEKLLFEDYHKSGLDYVEEAMEGQESGTGGLPGTETVDPKKVAALRKKARYHIKNRKKHRKRHRDPRIAQVIMELKKHRAVLKGLTDPDTVHNESASVIFIIPHNDRDEKPVDSKAIYELPKPVKQVPPIPPPSVISQPMTAPIPPPPGVKQ